jgi:hypothetical protein
LPILIANVAATLTLTLTFGSAAIRVQPNCLKQQLQQQR